MCGDFENTSEASLRVPYYAKSVHFNAHREGFAINSLSNPSSIVSSMVKVL